MVTTLVVSGKTAERVASTAGMLAEWMAGEGAQVGLADVAHTLNHHRARQGTFATVARVIAPRRWPGWRRWPRGLPRRGWWVRTQGPCRAGHGVRVFGSGFAVGGHGPAVVGR